MLYWKRHMRPINVCVQFMTENHNRKWFLVYDTCCARKLKYDDVIPRMTYIWRIYDVTDHDVYMTLLWHNVSIGSCFYNLV